ncbi:metalloprotease [Roseateles aquatilis]|uniref:Metalloprotease n=1 Tax=Roseateles aquatilis TaxID=431061 RepID=A0A246IWX1_9BURK|nr:neutral zinc metallopeptidase [Roseateles aquatilis]OWQ84701.1 metalloprotease [Roseateles aquatilis]
MKWEGQRESDNVEDARGGGGGGGGGGGLPMLGGRGLGIGGIVVALLASWIFGVNPLTVLGLLDGSTVQTGGGPREVASTKPQDQPAKFVSVVLADTEDVWTQLFKAAGKTYQAPKLRLFTGREPTACGQGSAAMGPFYCPGDSKVYIDLSFYQTLRDRLGAPGDFAQAYVIAHEVGHHVQHLLGITQKVDAARRTQSERAANALSVRVELQADCFAGVWTHHSQQSKGWLEAGDVDEALNAAAQIGDDTLQRRAGGEVVPESFTHGTSEQRQRWFKRGMAQGDLRDCDTFSARQL